MQHTQRRAHKLEAELRRAKEQLAFSRGEAAHLKEALKGRDMRLADLADRLRIAEAAEADLANGRAPKEVLEATEAERDELRASLQAMLERLEETTGLLGQADEMFSAMKQQLEAAEAERDAAQTDAAQASADAAAASAEVEDLRWRVSLLQQLADLTVTQNERQAASLRELLDSEALLDEATGGDGSDV